MLYIFIVYVVLCVIEKIEGYVTLNMNYVICNVNNINRICLDEMFYSVFIGYLMLAHGRYPCLLAHTRLNLVTSE